VSDAGRCQAYRGRSSALQQRGGGSRPSPLGQTARCGAHAPAAHHADIQLRREELLGALGAQEVKHLNKESHAVRGSFPTPRVIQTTPRLVVNPSLPYLVIFDELVVCKNRVLSPRFLQKPCSVANRRHAAIAPRHVRRIMRRGSLRGAGRGDAGASIRRKSAAGGIRVGAGLTFFQTFSHLCAF
jgi:hypothetical protein